jgi:hypothetical protein
MALLRLLEVLQHQFRKHGLAPGHSEWGICGWEVRWGEDRSLVQCWTIYPAHVSDRATSAPCLPAHARVNNIDRTAASSMGLTMWPWEEGQRTASFLAEQRLLLAVNGRVKVGLALWKTEKYQSLAGRGTIRGQSGPQRSGWAGLLEKLCT